MLKIENPSDRFCDSCGFMTDKKVSICPLCGDNLILFFVEVLCD